jgi:uncharacterized paraquat-inducible protein A
MPTPLDLPEHVFVHVSAAGFTVEPCEACDCLVLPSNRALCGSAACARCGGTLVGEPETSACVRCRESVA